MISGVIGVAFSRQYCTMAGWSLLVAVYSMEKKGGEKEGFTACKRDMRVVTAAREPCMQAS